ncbi:MAG: hypothetical protein PHX14_06320 [Syntrophomonadaceae bacterium]|nr:hypothetical protein [Syntrophomonadaceae bacterium]
MTRAYQLLLVMVLASLVMMGLNVSNQGISRLTNENRGQVIGVSFNNDAIELKVLSKDYVYKVEKLRDEEREIAAELEKLGGQSQEYLLRIWKIFIAIV